MLWFYFVGMPYNNDHSNVDSGDDSLPLIVDEADELEQRPGNNTMDESINSVRLSKCSTNMLC